MLAAHIKQQEALMWWVILFVLAALFLWIARKNKGTEGTGLPTEPHESSAWRDPLDEIDHDSVTYNGYKSVPLRVRMRYTDGQGQASEREVEILSYDDTTGIGMFEGFCHLRGARRSFYFARVSNAADAETGEIIADLRTHLNALWEQSTGPALRTLRKERSLELEVMLYMARADKSLRAAELAIITQYCRDATGDQRLDTTEIRNLLNHTSSTTLHGFKIKLGQLLNASPASAQQAAQACRAIVGTQKTVHPDEAAALEYLDRKMPQTTPS